MEKGLEGCGGGVVGVGFLLIADRMVVVYVGVLKALARGLGRGRLEM